MKEIYVVNCCRTAIGSFGGSLKDTPAADLGVTGIAAGQQEKSAKPQANRRYGRDEGYPGFCFHRAVTSRGKICDSIGSIEKVSEKRKKKSNKLLDFFCMHC